jgi:hypothetical protein
MSQDLGGNLKQNKAALDEIKERKKTIRKDHDDRIQRHARPRLPHNLPASSPTNARAGHSCILFWGFDAIESKRLRMERSRSSLRRRSKSSAMVGGMTGSRYTGEVVRKQLYFRMGCIGPHSEVMLARRCYTHLQNTPAL